MKRQVLVFSVCKMQMTNKQLGGVSLSELFSRFVMVYREYTEDWRFRARAPLSTEVRSHLSQPKQQQQQQQQRSLHTPVFHLGGLALVFSLTTMTSLSPWGIKLPSFP